LPPPSSTFAVVDVPATAHESPEKFHLSLPSDCSSSSSDEDDDEGDVDGYVKERIPDPLSPPLLSPGGLPPGLKLTKCNAKERTTSSSSRLVNPKNKSGGADGPEEKESVSSSSRSSQPVDNSNHRRIELICDDVESDEKMEGNSLSGEGNDEDDEDYDDGDENDDDEESAEFWDDSSHSSLDRGLVAPRRSRLRKLSDCGNNDPPSPEHHELEREALGSRAIRPICAEKDVGEYNRRNSSVRMALPPPARPKIPPPMETATKQLPKARKRARLRNEDENDVVDLCDSSNSDSESRGRIYRSVPDRSMPEEIDSDSDDDIFVCSYSPKRLRSTKTREKVASSSAGSLAPPIPAFGAGAAARNGLRAGGGLYGSGFRSIENHLSEDGVERPTQPLVIKPLVSSKAKGRKKKESVSTKSTKTSKVSGTKKKTQTRAKAGSKKKSGAKRSWGWGGKYKKKGAATGARYKGGRKRGTNSSRPRSNAGGWSGREQGISGYSGGRGGDAYGINIVKADPLSNIGGATITF